MTPRSSRQPAMQIRYPKCSIEQLENRRLLSGNLLANPDFSLGNTGFSSTLTFNNTNVESENTYAVGDNPIHFHSGGSSFTDHTTGTGLMMIVNGPTTSTKTVWQEAVPVSPNTSYSFAGFAASWGNLNHSGKDPSPANLHVLVNGTLVATSQLPAADGQWVNLAGNWNSGAAQTATIRIVDLNTVAVGNDFALDDVSFKANLPGNLTGTVFNDANANGVRDAGEGPIANARVFLDYPGIGIWNSATEPSVLTNSSGAFTFLNLAPAQYKIGLVRPAGTVRTAPTGDLVATVIGASTVNAGGFGVIPLAAGVGAISGVVYNDHNVNGVRDTGDAGLANVKVFLDLNGNGMLNTGEPSTLTATGGAYAFSNLKPGTYIISQIVPAGFRQGFPFGGDEQSAIVTGGAISSGHNFGDTTTSRVSGFVYENLNSTGTSPGNSGIPNVTVIVKPASGTGPSFTVQTNDVGYYVAGTLANQAYIVTLVPPSGFALVSGTLTRTTAALQSGQTADNINFVGHLTVPISFISQKRSLSTTQRVDPAYFAGSVPPGKSATGTGLGAFNQSIESSFNTGPISPQIDPDVHQITLDAKASQNSTITPAEITDVGSVSASENDGKGAAGSSFARAESDFQVTFRVYSVEHYSFSALLHELPMAVQGNADFGAAVTLTLTGPNGTSLFPILGPGASSLTQSGTLAVGTYTLTLNVTARDQADFFPSATYNLDMKFG